MRRRGKTLPVLMLTARGESGTACMASTWAPMTWPHRITELEARVSGAAASRRARRQSSSSAVASLVYDPELQALTRAAQLLNRPRARKAVLEVLDRDVAPGRVMSGEQLADQVNFSLDEDASPDAIEIYAPPAEAGRRCGAHRHLPRSATCWKPPVTELAAGSLRGWLLRRLAILLAIPLLIGSLSALLEWPPCRRRRL